MTLCICDIHQSLYRVTNRVRSVNEEERKVNQLFVCVNLDKGEYASPSDYGWSMEILDHAYVGKDFMLVIEKLLSDEWKHDRIVWAGEFMPYYVYTNEFVKDSEIEKAKNNDVEFNLHEFAIKHLNQHLDDFGGYTGAKEYSGYKYLVNHSKREFIRKVDTKHDSWNIHPLPLLTACGNGEGDSDYNGTYMEFIGRWTSDNISAEDIEPTSFREISPIFVSYAD